MQAREWANAEPQQHQGGITWNEMFILFDTAGHRTVQGEHIKSKAAKQRAEKRRNQVAQGKRQDKEGKYLDATIRPTFQEELNLFKKVVRHIAKHELPDDDQRIFEAEKRCQHRRVADLGVKGHQPAIFGYCRYTPSEHTSIVEGMIKQKIGSTNKYVQEFHDYEKKKCEMNQIEDSHKIKMKKVKLAIGTSIKWHRKRNKEVAATVIGYDPEAWIKGHPKLRKEEEDGIAYRKLTMPPPH